MFLDEFWNSIMNSFDVPLSKDPHLYILLVFSMSILAFLFVILYATLQDEYLMKLFSRPIVRIDVKNTLLVKKIIPLVKKFPWSKKIIPLVKKRIPFLLEIHKIYPFCLMCVCCIALQYALFIEIGFIASMDSIIKSLLFINIGILAVILLYAYIAAYNALAKKGQILISHVP